MARVASPRRDRRLMRQPVAVSPARSDIVALARRSWPLLAVLALYVGAMFIVPTLAPIPVSDDWVYARSVEILIEEGRVEILDLSVASLAFQVIWGALFASIFGLSFEVLRLSTLAIMLISAVALYALCQELGVSRGRAALGAAAYLFNPLAFSLGYSFMTDPHFTAWLTIATYFYVRGLRPGREGASATIAGSVAAACAILIRQQGVMISLAVAVYLLLSGRLRPTRAGVAHLARAVAIPAIVTAGYYYWLLYVRGVPTYQQEFTDAVREAGWQETRLLIGRLSFIVAMYLGLFALPLAAGALGGGRRLLHFDSRRGWLLFAAWAGLIVGGLFIIGRDGRRMPYVPHFIGPSGTGPGDLLGGRPWLIDDLRVLDWATALCAAGALLLGLILCRRLGGLPSTPARAGAGLLLAIGLWQALGVLPQSFSLRNWTFRGLNAPSLDRYFLPLLPIVICLLLWALRDVRLSLPAAWLVVGLFALFSVAATRDSLVFLHAIWETAEDANALGITNNRLDAGAAWDGYHLYEYSRNHQIPVQTPGGAWWLYVFAPATDSSYVVAGQPLGGYDVLHQRAYSSWLQRDPVHLYLLRRQGLLAP